MLNDGVTEDIYLEVTGNFFIVIYNYQKLTGDTAGVQKYSSNFQVYADYLIYNGIYPSSQRDTVDSIPATANQTNLAIVSTIGLNAYGAVTGNQTHTQKARDFVNEKYTKNLGQTSLEVTPRTSPTTTATPPPGVPYSASSPTSSSILTRFPMPMSV